MLSCLLSFSSSLGVPNKKTAEKIKAWNDIIETTEKKHKPLDPIELKRKESNDIYGTFMRKISKVTEINEFYVEYITQV